MDKMTKNQFEKKEAEIKNKISKLEELVKTLKTDQLPNDIANMIDDVINASIDKIYSLRNELHSHYIFYARRNWTEDDWKEYRLIKKSIE